ncbi:MAG: hypothetical protein ACI4MU_09210, partial [Candidatus Ventricola sp.]
GLRRSLPQTRILRAEGPRILDFAVWENGMVYGYPDFGSDTRFLCFWEEGNLRSVKFKNT